MKCASLAESFGHAIAGLWCALHTQRNARIHIGATIVVLSSGFFLAISPVELAILVLTVGMVLVAEMMNTALEAAVDLAAPQMNPLAKVAKDVAAGAVLLASVVAACTGILIVGPYLLRRLVG